MSADLPAPSGGSGVAPARRGPHVQTAEHLRPPAGRCRVGADEAEVVAGGKETCGADERRAISGIVHNAVVEPGLSEGK
jgi:hypothetical protein